MAALSDYLSLITDEHQGKPDLAAFLSFLLQGQVDNQNILQTLQTLFNVNTAIGQALDWVGVRVGQSRALPKPIPGVFFSWGVEGVGWGQGTWLSPGDDAETGLTSLPDDSYRILLKGVIAANQWDGTVPGAYAVWTIAFGAGQIVMQDNQDMTMFVVWIGPNPSAITLALFGLGALALKPAAVGNLGYYKPTATPIMALDIESDLFAGLDEGSFVELIEV